MSSLLGYLGLSENKAISGYHDIQFKFAYLCLFSGYGVLIPYIPVYFKAIGLTAIAIGTLNMIPNIATFTCAPIWSLIADRFAIRDEIMLLAFLGTVVSTLMFLAVKSYAAILCVVVITSILRSPSSALLDATVMSALKDREDYGKMRLWGAVGFGIFSFIGGWTTSTDGNDGCKNGICFHNMFFIYAAIAVCTSIIFLSIRRSRQQAVVATAASEPKSSVLEINKSDIGSNDDNHLQQLKPGEQAVTAQLLHVVRNQPSVLVFSLIIFLSGMGTNVIDTFLFIRLDELGGTGFQMGLARFVTCAAEVPMFHFAGYFQQKLGIWLLVAVTQFAFVVRFLYYGALINPWLVLPCEILHGLTYAVTWSVACSYASLIAPPGIQSTMIALVESCHWGLGGVGSLIGGYIYDTYGAVALFRVCAIMCGISTMLAFASWRIFPAPHATPNFNDSKLGMTIVSTHHNVLYEKAAVDDIDESTSGML